MIRIPHPEELARRPAANALALAALAGLGRIAAVAALIAALIGLAWTAIHLVGRVFAAASRWESTPFLPLPVAGIVAGAAGLGMCLACLYGIHAVEWIGERAGREPSARAVIAAAAAWWAVVCGAVWAFT